MFRLYNLAQKKVLVEIRSEGKNLRLSFLNALLPLTLRLKLIELIVNWLDLSRELKGFYQMGRKDQILSPLLTRYKGLRLLRIPNFFEATCWAIIGQQVNLTFAHSVKSQLVKKYGSSLSYEGETYYCFPTPQKISGLSVQELKKIQLSGRKAEYILTVAREILNKGLNPDLLHTLTPEEISKKLLKVRGIGPWTADYVLMKTFGYSRAYPVGDAGLQNAVKSILGLKNKPNETKLRQLAKPWSSWEAYATFFLWRSLNE